MVKKLAGKVAVVTGAGSPFGIGKETALAMAAEGAKVVVNDISKDPDGSWGADRVVKDIQKSQGTAVANYDSVASMEGGANIIKSAVSNFGRIDILVNTAGNCIMRPTLEMTEKEWDAMINVHLKGIFACSQPAIKEMIKQNSGGRIINITSASAWTPELEGIIPSAGYCAAKAGVLGFMRMLSLEFQKYGITVNAISPKARTNLFPMPGRVVNGVQIVGPDYVAPMLVYLATNEAKNITGQIIFAGSEDIIVYAPPMRLKGGEHQYLHKNGQWTTDELVELMPKMAWGRKPGLL